jgi:hypothetical protein
MRIKKYHPEKADVMVAERYKLPSQTAWPMAEPLGTMAELLSPMAKLLGTMAELNGYLIEKSNVTASQSLLVRCS